MIELRKYQSDYLAKLPSRAIFSADTGVGKTFMSLAHYEKFGAGRSLLILAPASKVKQGDWERDVEEYFAGRDATRPPEVFVMSYERFSRMPSKAKLFAGERPVYHKFWEMASAGRLALIADECHKAKNPQSGIGKAVFSVATVNEKTPLALLSATPASNGWVDVANYWKIFGFSRNKTDFYRRYVNIDRSRGFPIVMGYNHSWELKKKWGQIAWELRKDDALDMPDQTWQTVRFKKPTKYTTTLAFRKDEHGDLIENASKLSNVLRQSLTTSDKLNYLADIVEGTSENVVVFYNYISEREAILEMLKKKFAKSKHVFRQDGEKHELPGKDAWNGLSDTITLAQYKSGSTGVEMTYASITVFFSPTYSYQEFSQSIGRTYRSGQEKPTVFYKFSTSLTLESQAWACLDKKADFSDNMFLKELK